MAGGCSHKVLVNILFRRYAQNQNGFEDPKTNIRYKNIYSLVDPGVLATSNFSARSGANVVILKSIDPHHVVRSIVEA